MNGGVVDAVLDTTAETTIIFRKVYKIAETLKGVR